MYIKICYTYFNNKKGDFNMPVYKHILIGLDGERYYCYSSFKRFFVSKEEELLVIDDKDKLALINSSDIKEVLGQDFYLRDTYKLEG